MQTRKYLSYSLVVGVVSSLLLFTALSPARAQSIQCMPSLGHEDDSDGFFIADSDVLTTMDSDDRHRDGGALWYALGALPAMFALFHHGGGGGSSQLSGATQFPTFVSDTSLTRDPVISGNGLIGNDPPSGGGNSGASQQSVVAAPV